MRGEELSPHASSTAFPEKARIASLIGTRDARAKRALGNGSRAKSTHSQQGTFIIISTKFCFNKNSDGSAGSAGFDPVPMIKPEHQGPPPRSHAQPSSIKGRRQ